MYLLPVLLVATGAILLIYSLFICRKLLPLIKWPYMRKSWRSLFYLSFIFLAGYMLYLYALLTPKIKYMLTDSMAAAVLFSGAIFIAAAMKAGYQLVGWLATNEEDILVNKKTLIYDQGMLERDKKELDAKREELEKALEEVYEIRNKLEKRRGGKKMTRRLNELRNNLESSNK